MTVSSVDPFILCGLSTRKVAQQLSNTSSTLKKIETQALLEPLKKALNGVPSSVDKINTRVSAFTAFAGLTRDPSGSLKQFVGHSHVVVALSWISLMARTTSQTQFRCDDVLPEFPWLPQLILIPPLFFYTNNILINDLTCNGQTPVFIKINLERRIKMNGSVNFLTLLLFGLAVFRLTRLIVFDTITEPFRRPFFDEEEEVDAEGKIETYYVPKKTPLKGFIGQLLSCYWCTGVWVSVGLYLCYWLFPSIGAVVVFILAIAGLGALIEALLQTWL